MALLLGIIGVLSVCVSSQAGLTVEAGPGDDVTLWCEHGLIKSDYIFWYKHTCRSVPERVACKFYTLSSSNPCYITTESDRMVMAVYPQNSSLTVTAVNQSDSGLYYCSTLENKVITFNTATFLQLREKSDSKSPEMSKEVDAFSGTHHLFFKLTVVFAVLTMLLSILLILLVIIWMRKHRRDDANSKPRQEIEKQDGEMMNYAALHFSNKKNKRPHRRVEAENPHVVYSSVRQKRT